MRNWFSFGRHAEGIFNGRRSKIITVTKLLLSSKKTQPILKCDIFYYNESKKLSKFIILENITSLLDLGFLDEKSTSLQ